MEVWITVLGIVLFLGFGTAVLVCISSVKRQSDIIIESRLHHKADLSEIILANFSLIGVAMSVYLKFYTFIPALAMVAVFIVMVARIKSGITYEGVIIGTTFIEWEYMKSYKLVDIKDDSNVMLLKIRANRRQYVLMCNRKDKMEINRIFENNKVQITKTVKKNDEYNF